MELLVKGMENSNCVVGHYGTSEDISEWETLKLNDQHEVTETDSFAYGMEGTIDFEWLPGTTTRVSFKADYLEGTLNLKTLPESLIHCWRKINFKLTRWKTASTWLVG
mmetsp:Transcript_26158/g.40779  ORF Transcript_26158/g.40779 Transcript_26158/m.40779 type:complete len:108 (-) Transcript_26158:5-328(-)